MAADELNKTDASFRPTISGVTNDGNAYITIFKFDSAQERLLVEASIATGTEIEIEAPSTVYNGTKTVPTGTAEVIATTQAIKSVTVKALSTNTVAVYVGGSGCTTANGFELLAGESVSMDVSNLNKVYVISGSASQEIRYIGV